MNKKGLWMVYDSEEKLVCLADYDTALKEYEKYKEEQEYWVNYNEGFNGDEKVILAKVEKHFYPKFVEIEEETEAEIWDFVEEVEEEE